MSAGVSVDARAPHEAAPVASARLFARLAAAQEGRLLNWCPVALAAGIGLYFTLPEEPILALALFLAALGLSCLWLGRRAPALFLVGVLVLGFSLAKLRSELAATPLLTATTGEVAVSGRVIALDRASAGRLIMILAPSMIAGLPDQRLPKRLRLSLPARWRRS